ncbi:hypothetical protein AVEN_139743-1 [Araneus ventricosus]|uniref:Uncharacterized protein n=1 Tax=Araneus ventricosus TaxID=182803 RepID=A0A4Y2RXN2_ARAVE|nr:hypothetical protein AVEN_139743-1 [Araneus ventricosus]
MVMDRGDLVLRSWLRGRNVPGSKPDSTEDSPSMWARCTLNHTLWIKRPPSDVVRKLGETGTISDVDRVLKKTRICRRKFPAITYLLSPLANDLSSVDFLQQAWQRTVMPSCCFECVATVAGSYATHLETE